MSKSDQPRLEQVIIPIGERDAIQDSEDEYRESVRVFENIRKRWLAYKRRQFQSEIKEDDIFLIENLILTGKNNIERIRLLDSKGCGISSVKRMMVFSLKDGRLDLYKEFEAELTGLITIKQICLKRIKMATLFLEQFFPRISLGQYGIH